VVWVRTKGAKACLVEPLLPAQGITVFQPCCNYFSMHNTSCQAVPVARHRLQALLHRKGPPGRSPKICAMLTALGGRFPTAVSQSQYVPTLPSFEEGDLGSQEAWGVSWVLRSHWHWEPQHGWRGWATFLISLPVVIFAGSILHLETQDTSCQELHLIRIKFCLKKNILN